MPRGTWPDASRGLTPPVPRGTWPDASRGLTPPVPRDTWSVGVLRALDLRLLRLLRTRGHWAPLERVVLVFTRTGEHGMLWLVGAAAGATLDGHRRGLYLRAVWAVIGAYLVNIAAKHAIRRLRPVLEDLPALSPTVTGLSYPSAHSTTSFAAASVLARGLPAGPVYGCAGAMAVSRVYVGVHYPSDVAAGALLGGAVARVLAP